MYKSPLDLYIKILKLIKIYTHCPIFHLSIFNGTYSHNKDLQIKLNDA